MDEAERLSGIGSTGDAGSLLALGRDLEREGREGLAATAYDRAFGLAPTHPEVAQVRNALLDRLAVYEHGLRFRYIPAGSLLMGSADGDPDERPVHPVQLHEYWLSETPVSWAAYGDLMGWEPPPDGCPQQPPEDSSLEPRPFDHALFLLHQETKIRLQYCENQTRRAVDWHAHSPAWAHARCVFGQVPTDEAVAPPGYGAKPMVSVSWQAAEELCARLSSANNTVRYRLPTEAEWEKAARGGLIGARYAWGDEPSDATRCDFGRFNDFSIQPMRCFPPNGYGLYAMCGGVWEWTADWYDSEYYRASPSSDPTGPPSGTDRVLRGGSWADCAAAVTVSFRYSRTSRHWRDEERDDEGGRAGGFSPNVGFRICRVTARR